MSHNHCENRSVSVVSVPASVILSRADWTRLQAEHHARADALTAGHRERALRGETHPVWDFLFTYYSYKPSVMRKWHPGAGVALADAGGTDRADMRWYVTQSDGTSRLDVSSFRELRGTGVQHVASLLRATTTRAGRFDCFGMHEWAMVYRQDEHRHPVPLRLGQAGTDAVVEAADLKCTHYDAYRFFTPAAAPRNATAPTRQLQLIMEQPGCLHAGMDLYKWALKLGPVVSGDILLDAFELACDIRLLDMQASPYDITAWGYDAVPVETAAGKAEYVRRQREFAVRGEAIRDALIAAVTTFEEMT